MARGRGNSGRGRGDRGTSSPGRGRGRGLNFNRGRGAKPPGWSLADEDIDFTLKMFTDTPPARGGFTPRGGRGGRGGRISQPNSGTNTPSRGGRGYNSPRGRGRGQPENGIGSSPRGRGYGRGTTRLRADAPLSGLLYQERPLLKPIIFVPSTFAPVLFQEEEEIFKASVQETNNPQQSHAPTADQVFRVFSAGNISRVEESSSDDDEEEEIEEVDFNDIGKLFESEAADARKRTTKVPKSKLTQTITVEEQFQGFFVDSTSGQDQIEELTKQMDQALSAPVNTDQAAIPPPRQPKYLKGPVKITPHEFHTSTPSVVENIPSPPPSTLMVTESAVDPPSSSLFFIDAQPSPIPVDLQPPALCTADEDDDIIVYVAPHPRNASSASSSSIAQTSAFEPYVRTGLLNNAMASASSSSSAAAAGVPPSFTSVSFTQLGSSTPTTSSPLPQRLSGPPVMTPRQAKKWQRKRGLLANKNGKKGKRLAFSSFGALGALREEARLHDSDPKWDERRRGDSDLEWGDTDSDAGGGAIVEDELEIFGALGIGKAVDKGKAKAKEGNVDDVHGMEVDEDLDIDAMRSFVGGLLGSGAGTHVTMDDLKDQEVMRMEDEEGSGDQNDSDEANSSEDEELEAVLAAEEAMLISESLTFEDDEDEDDDEEDDDDQTPRTSFQARLERLRAKARSKKHADPSFEGMEEDSDENEDDDAFSSRNMTWAEEDDDFIAHIEDILDANEEMLSGKSRTVRKKLFTSIRDGDFVDPGIFPMTKRNKDKGKGLPIDLQAQWDKDRQKKGEYKQARELARLERAANPLSTKKGGKKGKKAMILAASLDPTITVIPNRIIDMTTLIQQIRRFIADVGGPSSMSLPPTNKETRKNVHELAIAFNLKSVSKGKGDARYTTLTKKTNSGLRVDEAKVGKIARRSGGMGARGDSFIYDKKGGAGRVVMPRHREGEEVGKAAPKIGQGNMGFKLLAMMGWSEGDRIGATGGLEAPLTAIIKHTKLGLGATK